jgi:hypothetical protein
LEWVGWCHRSKLPCGASSDNYRHVSRDVETASPAQQKEIVKNGGTDYRPKGDPWRVNVHYFEDKKLGKVVPCGVYDMTTNAGFVSVGIISDTAEFVVRSIRCRRERMGGARPTMIENFSRVCPAIGLSGLAAYRIGFPPNDIQRRGSDPSMTVPPWGRFNYE